MDTDNKPPMEAVKLESTARKGREIMESDNKQLMEALKLESTELNGRIQEVYKSMYALFGVILPAALTVFALLIKDAQAGEYSHVAFMFVAVVSLASLWSSALGMEVLTFLRYRYVSFQPRLYAASGQEAKEDLGTFSLTGHSLRWIPVLFLNVILFVVVYGVLWKFIPDSELAAHWAALCFLDAAVVACLLVHLARLQYAQEVKKLRASGGLERSNLERAIQIPSLKRCNQHDELT